MRRRRKDTGEPPLSMERCELRALIFLARNENRALGMASIGEAIWPKRTGKAQGFALAAGRIVHGLIKRDQVAYRSGNFPGYYITQVGLRRLRAWVNSDLRHRVDVGVHG